MLATDTAGLPVLLTVIGDICAAKRHPPDASPTTSAARRSYSSCSRVANYLDGSARIRLTSTATSAALRNLSTLSRL